MGSSFLGLNVEWWAILISLLAVLIAIFKDFVKPLIFSPKIKLYCKNAEFYIEEVENLTKHRYLRLKIINSGGYFSSTTKNCYVKLMWIKKEGNITSPFTPTILKWSLYDEETEPITTRKHDLAKGEPHFIDLCSESEKGKRILFFQAPIPPKLAEKLGSGKYTFKIGVYGDNFTPKYWMFNVNYTKNFGELNFHET